MLVISDRILVAEGHEGVLAARLRPRAHPVEHHRAHPVEHHRGFVRLRIGRPEPVAFHGEPVGGSALPRRAHLLGGRGARPAREQREDARACQLVAETLGVPVVATNRVGFGHGAWRCGGSFLLADDGTLVAQANEVGEEGVVSADRAALTPRGPARAQPRTARWSSCASGEATRPPRRRRLRPGRYYGPLPRRRRYRRYSSPQSPISR